MENYDYFCLIQAYIGLILLTGWFIWSYDKYGIVGTEFTSYLLNFCGLTGIVT
jgi:hypothetical protein